MTALYQETPDGGISVIPGRKAWGVDIPAYVYDLWMPLLGLECIAVYGLLWRLARDGSTHGMGIKRLSKNARMGDTTFMNHCDTLKECRFIQMVTPNREQRERGISTTYTILDPPQSISPELIEKYEPPSGYEPMTWWFMAEPEPEVSPTEDTPSPTEDTVSPDRDLIEPSVVPSIDKEKDSPAPMAQDDVANNSGEEPPSPSLKVSSDVPEKKERESFAAMMSSAVTHIESHAEPSALEMLAISVSPKGTKELTEAQIQKLRQPGHFMTAKMTEPMDCPSAIEMYDLHGTYWKYVNDYVKPWVLSQSYKVNRTKIVGRLTDFKTYWEWRERNAKNNAFMDDKDMKVTKRQITSEDLGIPAEVGIESPLMAGMRRNEEMAKIREMQG